MRTADAGELSTLASASRGFRAKVEVQNGSGTWIDYSRMCVGLDWGTTVDEGLWTGTLTFQRRDWPDQSLAPYNKTSVLNVDDLAAYSPAIDGMRPVRFSTATWPTTRAILPGDWKSAFEGYAIDVTTPARDVVVAVQDLAATLGNHQIKEVRTYGSDDRVDMEVVLQQILDDNLGVGVVTVVTPVSPNAGLGKFRQDRVRLFDALQSLARQIGWEIRFMWSAAGTPELRLFEPPRTKTVPDWTVDKTRIFDVDGFDVPTADIRNFWRVYYFRQGTRQLESRIAFVQESIDQYGLRYAEINEEETSKIDTPEEAQRVADAAAWDTAFPFADYGFAVQYNWALEPWDLIGIAGDDDRFTDAQNQAVTAIRHTITAKDRLTKVTTRGRVLGFSEHWRLAEGPAGEPEEAAGPVSMTALAAEASVWDGQLIQSPPTGDGEDDGMATATITVTENIKRVFVYGRQRPPGDPIELPAAPSAGNLSQIIERPDGWIPQGGYMPWGVPNPSGSKDWITGIQVPTTPLYGRGVLVYGETYDGRFTPPSTGKAIAAVPSGGDVATPNFSSWSIGRIDPTTIRTQVQLTPPAGGTVFVYIFRDGIRIGHMFTEGDGLQTLIFDDLGLDPGKIYNVWVWPIMFSATPGECKTGRRVRDETPVWTTGLVLSLPVAVNLAAAGEPEVPAVRLSWTDSGIAGTADGYRIEKSRDAGRADPWRDISGPLPTAPMQFDDRDYWAEASYRVVATLLGGPLDISRYGYFDGSGI